MVGVWIEPVIAQVLALGESGAAERIRLRLAEPLRSERYVFLAWAGAEYRRVTQVGS